MGSVGVCETTTLYSTLLRCVLALYMQTRRLALTRRKALRIAFKLTGSSSENPKDQLIGRRFRKCKRILAFRSAVHKCAPKRVRVLALLTQKACTFPFSRFFARAAAGVSGSLAD